MTSKIRAYQWPNVLALDAALIAIVWQMVLADALASPVGRAATIVLGLSVWLTYMADRLFDAAERPLSSLQSFRHRFAKQYRIPIWRIWWLLLLINLVISTQLSGPQFQRGLQLLFFCLLYTFLNQKLSRRFFPKEICVALIFAGGVVVFIPAPVPPGTSLSFAMLCLLNCLIIGAREKEIDARMHVHSMVPLLSERFLLPIGALSGAVILLLSPNMQTSLAASTFLLIGLHTLRRRIAAEDFRVLADATLLLGALVAYL